VREGKGGSFSVLFLHPTLPKKVKDQAESNIPDTCTRFWTSAHGQLWVSGGVAEYIYLRRILNFCDKIWIFSLPGTTGILPKRNLSCGKKDKERRGSNKLLIKEKVKGIRRKWYFPNYHARGIRNYEKPIISAEEFLSQLTSHESGVILKWRASEHDFWHSASIPVICPHQPHFLIFTAELIFGFVSHSTFCWGSTFPTI